MPEWTARIDAALERAAAAIRLLAAVTPENVVAERARLVALAESGGTLAPAWKYRRVTTGEARPLLDAVLRALDAVASEPLAAVYRARAEELALEAAIAEAAGTPEAGTLAQRRFADFAPDTATRARALAEAWKMAAESEPAERIASDASDERSLLSIVRREIGRRALPFRVVVHDALSSVAATGDGVVLVAKGRALSIAAAERTALHEIEGHVLPRVRAQKLAPKIFRMGTARGIDEQEGLALFLEARAGLLDGARRRDLAARAHAVHAMRGGASFHDVVASLVRELGVSPVDAVCVAERVFRGSDGTRPGLGREGVYLESFVRVSETLEKEPDREQVLASGQVSIDAVPLLVAYALGRA